VGSIAIFEGAADYLYAGNAMGSGFSGHHAEGLSRHWARAWRENPDALPDIGKFALLFGAYMRQAYQGQHYAKAQNLRRRIRMAYDDALQTCDAFAMPTMPFTATLLPPRSASLEQNVTAGLDMEGNTAPFDASGHPAITVPCGLCRGMPVGLMFIGRHFDERNVLRAAASFEKLGDWQRF
jgi:amidase